MSALRDLTNQKFGRLTVVGRAPNKHGKVYWRCVCEEGNHVDVGRTELVNGDTKSCGCLKRELTVQRDRERTKHGHCRQHRSSPEYIAWAKYERPRPKSEPPAFQRLGWPWDYDLPAMDRRLRSILCLHRAATVTQAFPRSLAGPEWQLRARQCPVGNAARAAEQPAGQHYRSAPRRSRCNANAVVARAWFARQEAEDLCE